MIDSRILPTPLRSLLAVAAMAVAAPLAAQDVALPFDALVGTWNGRGTGFVTTLSYSWTMPDRILEARNEAASPDGRVLARYRGAYVRHPDGEHWFFYVVGENGELHRGEARWRNGVLWHEATVEGGGVAGYASAVRVAGDTMRYFARYTPGQADQALLATEPIVYTRARSLP